jgi:translation initiation factor IF-2
MLGKSNKDVMKMLEEIANIKTNNPLTAINDDVARMVEKAVRPDEAQGKEDSPAEPPEPRPSKKKKIELEEGAAVRSAAEKLGVSNAEVVKALMSGGVMLAAGSALNDKAVAILSRAFGVEFAFVPKAAVQPGVKGHKGHKPKAGGEKPPLLAPRPPIVTVMGHVDHGKTTLLDTIRHTNVTAREAGGITQHIGAYTVERSGGAIVFLDTPGHEAFTAMRARGAEVTDIVILVVAADDGVMPQTREAIDHVRAAKAPIVVAVNKVDKPGAQPERVRRQLADIGLVPEEWGGDVIMVDISAKSGEGIDKLLEMVLLVAEMQELTGNANASPSGVVIEAELDKGKGPVATVIVRDGTLRRGDIILFGTSWGKVRAMLDTTGNNVSEAGPSSAVEILGLSDVPKPGETFKVAPSERAARDAMSAVPLKQTRDAPVRKASLEDLYSKMQAGQKPELNLLVKCDVQGSVEALCSSLEKIATDEVGVSIIHRGAGRIAESDVTLASASGAVILGFNVRPDANAKKIAEAEGIEIRLYNIIYDVINDVRSAMEGLLAPNLKERSVGEAEVREIFRVPKVGNIAGCHVTQGAVRRDSKVRVVRDGVVKWDGGVATLKHFKDEAREVKAGFDCGIALAGFQDFETGDVLEAYEVVEEKRTLG